MNNLFWILRQILIMREGAGGLFDFNGTLPLIGFQFILLTILLTFIFYKPVAKVIDERENYINKKLAEASSILSRADILTNECDARVKLARVDAKILVDETEKIAKEKVAVDLREAITASNLAVEKEFEGLNQQRVSTSESLKRFLVDLAHQLVSTVIQLPTDLQPLQVISTLEAIELLEFEI